MAAAAAALRLPVLPLETLAGPRRRPQQLEQVRRGVAAQVLPRPLPRRVPPPEVGAELVHQQPEDVLVVVDGGDVQRGVATVGLGVDVKGQTGFFNSVP